MVNLLGYKTYAAQGGDWVCRLLRTGLVTSTMLTVSRLQGSMIVRVMSNQYPETLLAVHFNVFLGPESADDEDTSQLSATELKQRDQKARFQSVGRGYSQIQNTKVSHTLPFPLSITLRSPDSHLSRLRSG